MNTIEVGTSVPETQKKGKRTSQSSGAGGMLLGLVAAAGAIYLLTRQRRDPEVDAIWELGAMLEDEGAAVLLDVRGSARPPNLSGCIPDIFALFADGTQFAIEVENDRSVGRSHARAQDRAFSKWASRSSRRHYEQIVIEGGRGGRG